MRLKGLTKRISSSAFSANKRKKQIWFRCKNRIDCRNNKLGNGERRQCEIFRSKRNSNTFSQNKRGKTNQFLRQSLLRDNLWREINLLIKIHFSKWKDQSVRKHTWLLFHGNLSKTRVIKSSLNSNNRNRS